MSFKNHRLQKPLKMCLSSFKVSREDGVTNQDVLFFFKRNIEILFSLSS